MSRIVFGCVLSLLGAGQLAAQTVFVVDALNRPGTSFTDLPAAVAAASDGDVIRVRSDGGNYSAVQTGKGITITADIGQMVIVPRNGLGLVVTGLPAGRQFTLRGALLAAGGATPTLQVTGCAGRVVLTQLDVGLGTPNIDVDHSDAVLVEETRATSGVPAVRIRNSDVQLVADQFGGVAADSRVTMSAAPALDIGSSRVSVVAGQITGGLGDRVLPPAPAAVLANAALTAATGGVPAFFRAGPAGGGTGAASAITGSGAVRLDPAVLVQATGSAPPTQGVAVVVDTAPALDAAARQDFLLLSHSGPATGVDVFVFGLPAGPLVLPQFAGALWVDSGVFLSQIGVPPVLFVGNMPAGATVVAQVVHLDAAGIELSNPVVLVGR